MKKTIMALTVMSLSVIANAQNSKKTINYSELKPWELLSSARVKIHEYIFLV